MENKDTKKSVLEDFIASSPVEFLQMQIIKARYNLFQAKAKYVSYRNGNDNPNFFIKPELQILFDLISSMIYNDAPETFTRWRSMMESDNGDILIMLITEMDRYIYKKNIIKVDNKRNYNSLNTEEEDNYNGNT